jgi:hypothetical protein
MEVLEPFLIDLNITRDHSEADIKAEIETHLIVQRYTNQFLKGQIEVDTFEQCLAQFGVDPLVKT